MNRYRWRSRRIRVVCVAWLRTKRSIVEADQIRLRGMLSAIPVGGGGMISDHGLAVASLRLTVKSPARDRIDRLSDVLTLFSPYPSCPSPLRTAISPPLNLRLDANAQQSSHVPLNRRPPHWTDSHHQQRFDEKTTREAISPCRGQGVVTFTPLAP